MKKAKKDISTYSKGELHHIFIKEICKSNKTKTDISFALELIDAIGGEILNKRFYLKQGKRPIITTPLYLAAKWGHTEIVKKLISLPQISVNKGEITNKKGKPGYTPLMGALKAKDINCVKALLNHPDIDPNIIVNELKINGFKLEESALSMAMTFSYEPEIYVQELLKHPNINPNLSISTYNKDLGKEITLEVNHLVFAISTSNTELISLLLSHPNIDISCMKDKELSIWQKSSMLVRYTFPELNCTDYVFERTVSNEELEDMDLGDLILLLADEIALKNDSDPFYIEDIMRTILTHFHHATSKDDFIGTKEFFLGNIISDYYLYRKDIVQICMTLEREIEQEKQELGIISREGRDSFYALLLMSSIICDNPDIIKSVITIPDIDLNRKVANISLLDAAEAHQSYASARELLKSSKIIIPEYINDMFKEEDRIRAKRPKEIFYELPYANYKLKNGNPTFYDAL